MIAPTDDTPWYIDVRPYNSSEYMSLDLCRYLPRRAMIGEVIVLHERPAVFLAVIKKRWMKLIREVERQYSSTLEPAKKEGLLQELERLHTYIFSSKIEDDFADVRFVTPEQIDQIESCFTVYIATILNDNALQQLLLRLQPRGLIVLYSQDPTAHLRFRRLLA
jgi:hypothetical protein